MAYVVPIVANRKNCRKSSPGALLAGLIIFLVFGIMFLLFSFNRSGVFGFNFSIILWIGGFMIFFAIILAISAAISATSVSKTSIKPNNGDNYKQQNVFQKSTVQVNPYKIRTSGNKVKEIQDKEIPVVEEIKYCRYCGAKKDLDAIFCQMCGTKF